MKASDWDRIQHFHAGENWGAWERMSSDFMRTLDTVRHLADTPFELTAPAWTSGGHASKSYHYIGRAADFKLPKKTPFEAYDLLVTTLEDMGIYGKVGFGFYPYGNPKTSLKYAFFHLDDRAMRSVDYKPGAIWVFNTDYIYGAPALTFIKSIRPKQGVAQ